MTLLLMAIVAYYTTTTWQSFKKVDGILGEVLKTMALVHGIQKCFTICLVAHVVSKMTLRGVELAAVCKWLVPLNCAPQCSNPTNHVL